MISVFTAKISGYIKIGLLVFIITLLIFIGIQYIRIQSLEKNVSNLEIKNAVFNKDNLFVGKKVEIRSDFTNSDIAIANITNEIIFSSNKQMAIDTIMTNFYK